MYKKLLALSLALVLCVCPVFAVSDSDNSYYAFDAVPHDSFSVRSFSPLASTFAWSNTDHDYLNQIRLALTSKNTGTLLSYIVSLERLVSSSFDQLYDIKQNTAYLSNISNNTNDAKSLLNQIKSNTYNWSKAQADSVTYNVNEFMKKYQGSPWNKEQADSVTYNMNQLMRYFVSAFMPGISPEGFDDTLYGYYFDVTTSEGSKTSNKFPFWRLMSNNFASLTVDGYLDDQLGGSSRTLYGRIAQLQETLASDEDKALSDAQKFNRDQVQQDFVSGSSGKTSLGASDFGDLSSVGGSVKDSISLNGQSSISGFTGGLSDANEAGQGWFSSSTRDALDTVSPSSSSSSRARRAPDDTYNMAGFADHYSWLYGG